MRYAAVVAEPKPAILALWIIFAILMVPFLLLLFGIVHSWQHRGV